MEFDFSNLAEQVPNLIITYGTKILLALVIFLVGRWLSRMLTDMLKKSMTRHNIDSTVAVFVGNLAYYILLVVIIIAALGQLGVQTASFIAIVGAAGLAVGFALQGSLANFAAGVLLILFRPCKVGDYVDAGGDSGTVSDISIFATTLLTPDNKTVTITNAAVMGNNIINYSTQPERRVDIVVGVSYSSDLDKVKNELKSIAEADSRVLTSRDVTIGVVELADSSINLVFRPWVKTGDYWPVYFDMHEQVKKRFDQVGIEIPFPQLDVHPDKVA